MNEKTNNNKITIANSQEAHKQKKNERIIFTRKKETEF